MSISRDQTYRIDTRKPKNDAETEAGASEKKGAGTAKAESKKPFAMIGGGFVLVFALVWFFFLRGPSSGFQVDHPTGFHFVCANGHEFTKTESDLRDYQANHLGEPIKCPQCGDTHVHPADSGPRAAGKKAK